MDLRSMVSVEVTKNDHKFTFLMPIGAPFGETYDAAFEVLSKIAELQQENLKKVARPAEDAPAEETSSAS